MAENDVKRISATARYKYRSDTLSNWELNNPILLAGEVGVVTGLNSVGDGLIIKSEKIKIGDGIHNWNDLAYCVFGDSVFNENDIRSIAIIELNNSISNGSYTNGDWQFYGNAVPSGTSLINNKSYWCYYIVAENDIQVWADDNLYSGSDDMWMCLYASTNFSDGTQQLKRTRQKKDGIDGALGVYTDNVPRVDSKWTIRSGQVLLVSIFKPSTSADVPPFRIMVSGYKNNIIIPLKDNVVLTGKQTEKIDKNIDTIKTQVEEANGEIARIWGEVNRISGLEILNKTCLLQYKVRDLEQHRATEALFIYIPSKVGYVRYDFYHSVRESMNADNWRLNGCYAVDDALTTRFALTTGGELECAIKLTGRGDFCGGIAHGDEIVDEIVFFVDGVKTDITTLTEYTEFGTLRIIEASRLFDNADHTTVIAKHGREYLFTESGMALNQFVKWEVAAGVDLAYLNMFLPSKTSGNKVITNRAYTSNGFETIELGARIEGDPLYFPNAKKAALWAEESGFYGSVEVTEFPTGLTGGDRMMITDNSGLNYNKVYFYAAANYTTTVGETWRSKAKYELEVGEGTSTT